MIALALAWLGRNKLVAALGGALLLVLLIGGAYAKGRMDEAHLVRERAATAQALQDVKSAVATGHADVARQIDTATTATLEKDLKHADDAQPDARPSGARLAQSCERLRRQGADLAKVPGCSGPGGRSQAPAQR